LGTLGSILVQQSRNIQGTATLVGAKNATLPIIASLLLTQGKNCIKNVPNSSDVMHMMQLLKNLGALVEFDAKTNILHVDTSKINKYEVCPDIMNKMRASILVMGPLLARFSKAKVALPGGCLIGARPIDLHLKSFEKLGINIERNGSFLQATCEKSVTRKDVRIVLEYPSVGATENILMFATLRQGMTTIVNAALEPEVLDVIAVLKKMGADVEVQAPAMIKVVGVQRLFSVEHFVIPDRLEAGALLLAAAITGGSIYLPDARADHMDIFLEKLKQMGHEVIVDNGIQLNATKIPQAVSFKTGPYPGFPTDLQAPMMAAQVVARGKSCIEETVFENRFMHIKELQKMGAQIEVKGSRAFVSGVEELYGAHLLASDIRASCALVIAALVANSQSTIMGIHHWRRGYDGLEDKLAQLGAQITITG
jgi:UDP-N-acetylglucosamine 1-carboxyvinyltransferase